MKEMICSKYEKLMRRSGRNNKESDSALNVVNRSGKIFKKKLKDIATIAVKLGIKELIVGSWIKIKTTDHQVGVRIKGIMLTLKIVLN